MPVSNINYLKEMGIVQWKLKSGGISSDETLGRHVAVRQEADRDQAASQERVRDAASTPQTHVIEGEGGKRIQDLPLEVEPVVQNVAPENKDSDFLSPKEPSEQEPETWEQLTTQFSARSTCVTCQQTTPILGQGNINADWVFIIDAPSSQDIAQQVLCTDRTGVLFEGMLAAIGEDRDSVYLTSVFKCAPSEEYNSEPSCSSLLRRQMALIKPKNILTFGEFSGQTLLRSNLDFNQLRGSIHQPRSLQCNVAVTYSLQELLRTPALKAEVWVTLCQLMGR